MSELQAYWPQAKAKGIEYQTYYARVRSGMPAYRAAAIPADPVGRNIDPDSIIQLCNRHRIGRQNFYDTRREMQGESGRMPEATEVVEAIEKRRGEV